MCPIKCVLSLVMHPAAEVHVHYVVRLTQNDSVCIVRSDQIQPSAGPDLAIGAGCEVVTHGGTQEAVIIGVGQWPYMCTLYIHVRWLNCVCMWIAVCIVGRLIVNAPLRYVMLRMVTYLCYVMFCKSF